MKSRVTLGAVLWLAFITVSHLWWNVGFAKLSHRMGVALGEERDELVVGFLPVT